jgi:hypothetical protein
MSPDAFPSPRHFARAMLAGGLPITGGPARMHPLGNETVLFREGCWQISLVQIPQNGIVPAHRHLRSSSADLLIHGGGDSFIGKAINGRPSRGELSRNLIVIQAGAVHGGVAGPDGSTYLSFQRWEGEPGFLTEDWQGW